MMVVRPGPRRGAARREPRARRWRASWRDITGEEADTVRRCRRPRMAAGVVDAALVDTVEPQDPTSPDLETPHPRSQISDELHPGIGAFDRVDHEEARLHPRAPEEERRKVGPGHRAHYDVWAAARVGHA